MKAKIKRTSKNGNINYFEVYLREASWEHETSPDGFNTRLRIPEAWCTLDGTEMDEELDLFLDCEDVGALYEHPSFTFEIIEKS